METYSIICEAFTNNMELKGLVKRYEGEIKSPCYINLITDKGEKLYYAEKSNLELDGAGWILMEKHKRGANTS